MRNVDVLVLASAIGLLAYALVGCGRRPAAVGVRASPVLTPGVLNAAVTEATIHSTICRRGWSAEELKCKRDKPLRPRPL